MELQYQALPANSGFVELVRSLAQRDIAQCQAVGFVPHWLAWGRPGAGGPAPDRESDINWPEARPIWEWCCEAVGRYPDIGKRNFYVGKRIMVWKFLLSARYRRQVRWPPPKPTDERSWNDPESAFDDLVDIIFLGAPELAPGVTGDQFGSSVQYIAPSYAVDIGSCIAAMEPRELIRHLDEAFVWSYWHRDDRPRLESNIAELLCFWRDVANNGDGVLVVHN